MSAIAGVWRQDGGPDALAACERISRALALYGPHRDSCWNGGEIAFAHRLMRFLPEDRFDRQPLSGRDGRLRLIADCRLDNRDDLGRALNIDAQTQRQMSDADYILAALEKWGQDAPSYLVGDFAFAVWESDSRTLMLVRDHAGARPLHYHSGENWFAFSSMPKGLLALPDVPSGPDPIRMATWEMLAPLIGPRSFYAGVSRLEPGQIARIFPDGRVDLCQYWDPCRIPRKTSIRGDEDAEGLRDVLDQAIKAQLRGTGETALMLSSGLDSTAIASRAAPLLEAQGRRLTAFTNVPIAGEGKPSGPFSRVDEGPLAAAMAACHPNIDHHLVRGYDGDLMAVMERVIFLADQPVMNPLSTLWVNEIYRRAARSGMTVVLTGILGNMGLTYTGEHAMQENIARLGLWPLWRDSGILVAEGIYPDRASALRAAVRPWLPAPLINQWHRLRGHDRKRDLEHYLPIRLDTLPALGLPADAWKSSAGFIPIRTWPEWHRKMLATRDPGPINAAANAAHGVDRRDPTGDRRVLEYCLSLPPDRFLRNGRVKDVFRRAFTGHIPPEILNSQQVGQQTADWKSILLKARPQIRQELAHQERIRACDALVDLPSLKTIIETLENADPEKWTTVSRYFLKLTRGLSAGLFIRRASGGN